MADTLTPYITRFAPSPTGALHLGHAYSALIGNNRAHEHGGQFLLRIEDIDTQRCRPEWEAAIYRDLHWLGLNWPKPVLRQSSQSLAYQTAMARLFDLGLTYHCSCTRGDIRAALAAPQESAQALFGPDGPVYPGTCRNSNLRPDQAPALRLNIARALEGLSSVSFTETGYQSGVRFCTAKDMIATLGDVVLARKDIGVSYHLAVVVDDGAQNITEVVRGLDLQPATAIHQLLQHHLGLPRPRYHHHHLIRDTAGKRLAKRDDARSLASFRAQGMACDDVLSALGLEKPL